MCISILTALMYARHIGSPEEIIRYHGSGVRDVCELPWWCGDLVWVLSLSSA